MFWKMKGIDEKRVAAIDNTDLITYGDVKRHIEEIQSITAERNVVLILSDNSVGSYLGYICFLYMNCAVILLENTVKEEFCKAMIEKYRPKKSFSIILLFVSNTVAPFDIHILMNDNV